MEWEQVEALISHWCLSVCQSLSLSLSLSQSVSLSVSLSVFLSLSVCQSLCLSLRLSLSLSLSVLSVSQTSTCFLSEAATCLAKDPLCSSRGLTPQEYWDVSPPPTCLEPPLGSWNFHLLCFQVSKKRVQGCLWEISWGVGFQDSIKWVPKCVSRIMVRVSCLKKYPWGHGKRSLGPLKA